jgi:hypothetical protein
MTTLNKHFYDYNPTEKELANFTERQQERLKSRSGDDGEKRAIALLIFLRGHREECRKMLESIENEDFRQMCLEELYPLWLTWADGGI